MGARAKSRARSQRKIARKAQKEARKAQYRAWAEAGQNKKSKRFVMRSRARKHHNVSHPNGPCGNIGCDGCRGRGPCRHLACNCGNSHLRAA